MNKQLTNQDLINLWLSQTQSIKENKKLHFEGQSLYNSKNVELARIIDNETIFINWICYDEYRSEIVKSVYKKNIKIFRVKSFTEHLKNTNHYKAIIKEALAKVNSRRPTANTSGYVLRLGLYLEKLFKYIQKMQIPIDSEITEWRHKIENNCLIEMRILEKIEKLESDWLIEKNNSMYGTTPTTNSASFHLEILNEIK